MNNPLDQSKFIQLINTEKKCIERLILNLNQGLDELSTHTKNVFPASDDHFITSLRRFEDQIEECQYLINVTMKYIHKSQNYMELLRGAMKQEYFGGVYIDDFLYPTLTKDFKAEIDVEKVPYLNKTFINPPDIYHDKYKDNGND